MLGQHRSTQRKPPQPDPRLGETLRGEGPGILRWMIEGCLTWQRADLAPPQVVRAATEEYLADQDVFAAWAAERLTFGPDLSERPGTPLADFNAWALRNGKSQRSRHALKAWLDRHPNLGRRRVRGADYVTGAALRPTGDLEMTELAHECKGGERGLMEGRIWGRMWMRPRNVTAPSETQDIRPVPAA